MSSKKNIIGFGFIPEENEHHFMVNIQPKDVLIAELLNYEPESALAELSYKIGKQNTDLKVILSRKRWDLIAEEARAEFNRRLKKNQLPVGKWSTNRNYVSRLFGKELVLLCWAIEDADPTVIPSAIKNWLGLKPEERWWLFTMTNAASGHAIYDRNIGWRKAVRFALTENPVSMVPRQLPVDHYDSSPLYIAEEPEAEHFGANEK